MAGEHPMTRPAVGPTPVLYNYKVQYITANQYGGDEKWHNTTVVALDAIDAKHVAGAHEGATIIWASARRVGLA